MSLGKKHSKYNTPGRRQPFHQYITNLLLRQCSLINHLPKKHWKDSMHFLRRQTTNRSGKLQHTGAKSLEHRSSEMQTIKDKCFPKDEAVKLSGDPET